MNKVQFKISQLQHQNMVGLLESISIFIFSLMALSLLPRILFDYYYSKMNLTAEPAVLTHMPLFFFTLAVLYFVITMVRNVMRLRKIAQLEKVADMMMGDSCCTDCDNCNCSTHEGCMCGCEVKKTTSPVVVSASSEAMAQKMSQLSRKRKVSKRK